MSLLNKIKKRIRNTQGTIVMIQWKKGKRKIIRDFYIVATKQFIKESIGK
ncbi:MAG: hypothetical protein PHY14_02855 [Candidatus Gracilibacteria bacterium]|nr:hypothetical protein [Candidatus Gracilibacteria bacterium]